MNRDTIKRMAYAAGVTEEEFGLSVGWGDLERFAKLVETKVRDEDREQALAFLRQLHDSFSLASNPTGLRGRK
jgi:hypothetical protein